MKTLTTGLEQSEQSASRTAGWSNVESCTAHYGQHHIYFGPFVVSAANFAVPLDGPSDVNIRTACWGYGFLFQLLGGYLKNYLIRVQKAFLKSDLYFSNKY